MFINKAKDGLNNVCGKNVAFLRKNMGLSQRQLADALQLAGLDIDKNAVQRIECGKTLRDRYRDHRYSRHSRREP